MFFFIYSSYLLGFLAASETTKITHMPVDRVSIAVLSISFFSLSIFPLFSIYGYLCPLQQQQAAASNRRHAGEGGRELKFLSYISHST